MATCSFSLLLVSELVLKILSQHVLRIVGIKENIAACSYN